MLNTRIANGWKGGCSYMSQHLPHLLMSNPTVCNKSATLSYVTKRELIHSATNSAILEEYIAT